MHNPRAAATLTATKSMSDKVRKHIEVPAEELKKFESRHPSRGAFTWFVTEALTRYNQINETSPEELVELAVDEITFLQ